MRTDGCRAVCSSSSPYDVRINGGLIEGNNDLVVNDNSKRLEYVLFCIWSTPYYIVDKFKLAKPCNRTRVKIKTLHRNIVEAIILTGCTQ